jgi:hypothetical protein
VTSDSSAPPTRPPAESAAPIPAPQTLDPAHPTSASPPDRTLAINNPAGLSADAKLYLALAILFLFVACVFGYFLFRRPRTTFGPSLISRMMDEEKDKK